MEKTAAFMPNFAVSRIIVVMRAGRIAARDEVERLEDVRLAGPIAADQSGDPGRQHPFGAGVAPEILE